MVGRTDRMEIDMALKLITFKTPGYATVQNAQAKLSAFKIFLDHSHGFVAAQDGRFFPVAVLGPEDQHNAFHLARNGIFVTA